jgi:nucleotide-binding universal stress UspA family protein
MQNPTVSSRRNQPVRRVMVATDRSESADFAVGWAAEMAKRYAAELWLVQVIVPQNPPGTEAGAAEATRASYAAEDLKRFAEEFAGDRGRARVVVAEEPSQAIVDAADADEADVLVVGNVGMSGRKEFLLGNVPNRVSHKARCTVVIVNSAEAPVEKSGLGRLLRRDR